MRFTSPPNRAAYYAQVWEVVRQIPRGRVATYGGIAALVRPAGVETAAYHAFGPRWVGGALANCPDNVPWQRVVNAQGGISPRPGAQRQEKLLLAEGVEFDARDRVDLNRFGWRPVGYPDSASDR
jgi:methylated-DNA-protein-cysteine methyltransferase-like protein